MCDSVTSSIFSNYPIRFEKIHWKKKIIWFDCVHGVVFVAVVFFFEDSSINRKQQDIITQKHTHKQMKYD